MGGLEKFCPLLAVAGKTHIRLGHFIEYGVMCRMDRMATGTGYFCNIVRAAFPANVSVAFMAAEAHAILGCYRLVGLGTEIQDRWSFLSRSDLADMTALLQSLLHE